MVAVSLKKKKMEKNGPVVRKMKKNKEETTREIGQKGSDDTQNR